MILTMVSFMLLLHHISFAFESQLVIASILRLPKVCLCLASRAIFRLRLDLAGVARVAAGNQEPSAVERPDQTFCLQKSLDTNIKISIKTHSDQTIF